jgi:hypothetical protein
MAINPETASFYYSYRPYLQPTPSLGTGARITGSVGLGTRPQIGGVSRIYNYYKSRGQGPQFINTLLFDIYGIRRS